MEVNELIEADAPEGAVSIADEPISPIFDRIVNYQFQNQDDRLTAIEFSINSIREITDKDGLIQNFLDLIQRAVDDQPDE